MSGPAIHHIVAEQFLNKVLKAKYTDPGSARFWNEMSSGRFGPIYLLGAQGPDFLFFNMSDWPLGGAVKTVAQTYWEVQEFVEDLVAKVKAMIPPELWQAIDTLETLAEGAVERSATLSEIASLASDVKNNIAVIQAAIETKIEEYITDFDLFSLLKHPQQHGQPYADWWWFDTMHIRRSGTFMSTLLQKSQHGSQERAYALGYLTHYVTDAVGHPFVNIVSGGPYRTHGQRHKVVENHQDTWALHRYRFRELPTSNLAKDYVISGNPDKLPPAISRFLVGCIERVYFDAGRPVYGKKITPDDLDVAYRAWLAWFTRATNDLGLPLPQPYSMTAEIVDAWNKFVANVGGIAGYVGSSMSGGGGLLGFLKALAAAILGPVLLAGALIDFVLGEITTLGAAPIRFFLSLTYQALYDAYLNLRKGLVTNGFAFPRVSDLNDPIVKHMLHTRTADLFGHDANSLRAAHAYPASKFVMPGMEGESHLVYPLPVASNAEGDPCCGAPNGYFSADASWYIDAPRNMFSQGLYEYFQSFVESGTGGATAAAVNARYAEFAAHAAEGGLGSAVAFGDAMYADYLAHGRGAMFPDFNLDSDRGYAFKSWRKVRDIALLNKPQFDPALFNVPIELDHKVPNVQDDVLYPDRRVP